MAMVFGLTAGYSGYGKRNIGQMHFLLHNEQLQGTH